MIAAAAVLLWVGSPLVIAGLILHADRSARRKERPRSEDLGKPIDWLDHEDPDCVGDWVVGARWICCTGCDAQHRATDKNRSLVYLARNIAVDLHAIGFAAEERERAR